MGKKALYLNSFYIDRRYYLPYTSITRVFKRVAMSAGGFTGKGMFASMAYLVVEYDGGKQKQCTASRTGGTWMPCWSCWQKQPQIRLLLSAAGGRRCRKRLRKGRPQAAELSEDAKHTVTVLRRGEGVSGRKAWALNELSAAQRRKRAQLKTSRSTAMWPLPSSCSARPPTAPTACTRCSHTGSYGVYFALFGFAAIFLFSSYNMLPRRTITTAPL